MLSPELKNLRVSFLLRNPRDDILHSVADATNWPDLPLLIYDRADCFGQNMVGVMVLNPDQETALDNSDYPPRAKLLLQEFEDAAPHDVRVTLPTDHTALPCNQQFLVWRKRIVAQSATSCPQQGAENTYHLLAMC